MMHLFIPSMGRAGNLEVLQWIPPQWKERTCLVVPPEEDNAYCEAHDHDVWVVACPAKGIDHTRQWIGQYAEDVGSESFMMFDDDIQFYINPDLSTWKLQLAQPIDVQGMLTTCAAMLRNFKHIGIAPREGYNHFPRPYAGPGRVVRALGFQTEAFNHLAVHGRVPVMEDFDVTLQLLRRGYPNRILSSFAQGQKESGMEGGCSTYRTAELQAKAAHRLAELHPGLVSVVRKKTGNAWCADEEGYRTDVRVQWVKAWEQGMLS